MQKAMIKPMIKPKHTNLQKSQFLPNRGKVKNLTFSIPVYPFFTLKFRKIRVA